MRGADLPWARQWVTAAAMLLVVLSLGCTTAPGGDEPAGQPQGVAAGGDIRESTINIGIPPDQVAVITEALRWAGDDVLEDTDHTGLLDLTDEQRQTITKLEDNLGVSAGALKAFFRALGEVPPERQEGKLVEIAERYKQLVAQVAAAPGDDPEVAKLKGEAKAALDAGQLERADDLLAQVQAAQDGARRQLEAAATAAQRGEIALTRLRYRDAAQHFAAAAELVPPGHEEQYLAYVDRKIDAESDPLFQGSGPGGVVQAGMLPDLAAAGRMLGSPIVRASRIFAGQNKYPPTEFAAYGILAFRSRPSPHDRDRHLMFCNVYVATLPHADELEVPRSEQMVTVWPIVPDDYSDQLNLFRNSLKDICQIAIDHYGLAIAQQAIKDAELTGRTLSRAGPFLLAWSPSADKGKRDALVLVSDLSDITTYEQALERFVAWSLDIESDPALWMSGWDLERLRTYIRSWVDKYGEMSLRILR